jgi:hypothetical protein
MPETGGLPIITPPAVGHGTSVIWDLIFYELAWSVDHVLASDGARFDIEIPATWRNFAHLIFVDRVPTLLAIDARRPG